MSIHRLRITAAPDEGAAVHADLATDTVAAQAGLDLGTPEASFDATGRPLEESREVAIPLLIRGARSTVGQVMQDVARAISVTDRWLMVQRTPSTDPVWYRITPRSPGTFSMSDAYTDSPGGWWRWDLTLTVDSTAVGARRAVPMVGTESVTASISNTGVDRGVVIDAPGEAPCPLSVDIHPSVNINGRRVLVSSFSVPWDSPLINGGRPAIIREDTDFDSGGTATRTTDHASMSGGTALTLPLSGTGNYNMAVTSASATWRPEPGRYLVMARLFREGGTGEVKLRMSQQSVSGQHFQPWREWRPASGGSRASWMPIGYLQHPLGDSGEGLSAAELMPPSIRIDVTPTVTSDTGLLHLDQVAFVPVDLARGAHESATFTDFANGIGFGGDFTLRVDGERRRTAVVDYVGQHHAVPQPLRTGGWPVATPGMATCVSVFLDTTDAPVGIDSVSITSTLRVDTSPRLLHLGQER